jgi:DNA helicase-2/ATP-dependent DNA helicase PcrA
MTYDIVCKDPHHNFVANGIVVHNSGKTATIIEKIRKIKVDDPEAKILYITFTRKAREEADARLVGIPNVTIFNFHGLAYSVLSCHKKELQISEIDIVNDSYCIEVLSNLFHSDDNKEIRKKLGLYSKVRNENIPREEWDAITKAVVIPFEAILRRNKKYTFDDILATFYNMMKNNQLKPHYFNSVLKFDYIMVDEVNDVNKIQYDTLDQLVKINPNAKLTLCGDIQQSIYGWRYARPDLASAYIKKYNMKLLHLTKNFRSQENIINAANRVLDLIQEYKEFKYEIIPVKPKGSKVEWLHTPMGIYQNQKVCDTIKEYITQGYSYRDHFCS